MLRPTLTSPCVVKEQLASEGISLKHSLGQNFLISQNVLEKILNLADVCEGDEVVEVGPGIGTLTVALLSRNAKVTSIEKDSTLFPLLLKNTSFASENFKLIDGDVTNECVFENIKNKQFKLVSNLPYNIATMLIYKCFKEIKGLKTATVMVQKEVAERMSASVGAKSYGAYTVKLSFYAEVAGSFLVGRNNFYPPPNVDSAVVKLTRKKKLPVQITEEQMKCACKVVDATFLCRRKTILNSCKSYFRDFKPSSLEEWLKSCDINPETRGEKLDSSDYLKLGIMFDKFFNK